MTIGYLGPPGTFSHEALIGDLPEPGELRPYPSIRETVLAVHDGEVEFALVPLENSIEGPVGATLDTLALEATDVRIVGEVLQPITQCLIAREQIEPGEASVVLSHPHATAQCAGYLRTTLPQAEVRTVASTAEAVRLVAEHGDGWVALAGRLAAERYGCVVLAEGVADDAGNETRFVWLAKGRDGPAGRISRAGAARTSIVFWGPGASCAGWLVECLREFAERGVNLTRIESRSRRAGLGSYMFFIELEGREGDPAVDGSLAALAQHAEHVRVLGAFG